MFLLFLLSLSLVSNQAYHESHPTVIEKVKTERVIHYSCSKKPPCID